MTTKTLNPATFVLCATILSASLLSGCGGGGGGGSAVTTQAPTSTSFTPPSGGAQTVPIVTAVPTAPSYTGEELIAYNAFNTARTTCGFGYLQQNTHIDIAAYNHVKWMAVNNTIGHYEATGTPSFVGTSPADRLSAAGYSFTVLGEVLTSLNRSNKSGYGALAAVSLLSAPYHMEGIFQGNREIGISLKSSGPIGSGQDIEAAGIGYMAWLVADMGATTTFLPQKQAASDVLTYPCQGVTGTAYQLQNESPNPVPGRNLLTNPIGQPILIQVVSGNALSITTVTVTGPSGAIALLPTMTGANDPNGVLSASQAIVMPNVPLQPSTSYSVVITGTNNGATFNKSFSYTTGT